VRLGTHPPGGETLSFLAVGNGCIFTVANTATLPQTPSPELSSSTVYAKKSSRLDSRELVTAGHHVAHWNPFQTSTELNATLARGRLCQEYFTRERTLPEVHIMTAVAIGAPQH
jgi:hypothetical protein